MRSVPLRFGTMLVERYSSPLSQVLICIPQLPRAKVLLGTIMEVTKPMLPPSKPGITVKRWDSVSRRRRAQLASGLKEIAAHHALASSINLNVLLESNHTNADKPSHDFDDSVPHGIRVSSQVHVYMIN